MSAPTQPIVSVSSPAEPVVLQTLPQPQVAAATDVRAAKPPSSAVQPKESKVPFVVLVGAMLLAAAYLLRKKLLGTF